ncbi:hypothetical protein [Candidatus Pyrohabitans sp.]
MSTGVKAVLLLFVASVLAAGFILPGEAENYGKDPREVIADELLKKNIILEDYYITKVSEVEKALDVDIDADPEVTVGFLMMSGGDAGGAVFEYAAEVVLNASPELEGVAMLRLDSVPRVLVYAPRGAESYEEMQPLPMRVEKLFEKDIREKRVEDALLEQGMVPLRVQIVAGEKLGVPGGGLAGGEVMVILLKATEKEFRDRFRRIAEVSFETDEKANALLVGSIADERVEAVDFYLVTREEYRKGELRMEELQIVSIPVR